MLVDLVEALRIASEALFEHWTGEKAVGEQARLMKLILVAQELVRA